MIDIDGPLIWGPYSLRPESATSHFLASGTTGSGKTTLIDMLLRSVFRGARSRASRALIYDSKQEAVPKLRALGLGDRVRILHPFDERGRPWDLATDIADPLSARQFAHTLIPESRSQTSDTGFFLDAARDIISVTVQVLGLCTPSGRWTLRDLILSLLYPDNLKPLLAFEKTREGIPFPSANRIWRAYFDPQTTDERTRSNIRSTLSANLGVFEPVAAAWASSTLPPFSLKTWHEGNGDEIVVVGNDESARAAIDPINQALFQRAAELTLARPEGQVSKTWFFLDEVREAGRLRALNSLLLRGRSKGACVVLSFQDIEGLRDVYGDHLANEIVANCNNVALLRTSSSATAEWAAEMFGRFLVIDRDRTSGLSGTEVSSSRTERLNERPSLLSGDMLYLPLPSPKVGLVGFFRDAAARFDEPHRHALEWGAVSSGRIDGGGEDGFQSISTSRLLLRPWDQADLDRLGIEVTPEAPTEERENFSAESAAAKKKRIPRRAQE